MKCFSLHGLRFVGLFSLAVVMVLGSVGCATKGGRGGAPTPPGGDVSDTGGPLAPPRDSEFYEVPLKTVYFDYDKSNIRGDAAEALDWNANWLKENPNVNVRIEGHCDNRGSDQYNMALGERRALSIREYLIGKGIDGNRLYTISYGESMPAIPNARTEAEHAKNRRGEFKGVR